MVNVLFIGTGQIGKAAARACAEAGHRVYGVVRDEKKGVELLRMDVTPIVGDANKISTLEEAIAKCSVIVDSILVYGQDFAAANKAILAAVAAESKKSGVKKRYIYVSGGWVYGDYPGELVEETYPCKNPPLAWRIAFEKLVITNQDVHGVVVRPSAVYGDDWGIWLRLWQPTDKMVLTGHHDRIVGWNHSSDVGDAIMRIVEAPNGFVCGEIFDIAEETRIQWYDLRRAIFKVAGYKVKEEEAPLDEKNYLDSLNNIRALPSAQKIRRVLGWKPRHCILDYLEISWKHLSTNGLIKKA